MRIVAVCLFLLSSASYANDSELYCPKISDLKQTDMKWNADTEVEWKEAEESFVTQIASFEGAQWQGISVGQVSCIYKGADSTTFPIVLQNNHMFKQPNHTDWIKSGNSFNCLDSEVENCPLFPYIEKKEPTNLYDMLNSLKN